MYSKKSYFHFIFLLVTSVMFSKWNCMSSSSSALSGCLTIVKAVLELKKYFTPIFNTFYKEFLALGHL